jgi:hypothetical protein
MSTAASGLLRALIARAGVSRDRILLTAVTSTDWQSLTMAGERHVVDLRVIGRAAASVAHRLCSGLEDAEFSITGQIVADIAVIGELRSSQDGSVTVKIEALTIAE